MQGRSLGGPALLIFRPDWGPNGRKKKCFRDRLPPYLRFWITRLPLLSEGSATVIFLHCNRKTRTRSKPSSETQGQSVGPGEKARRKFSSTGGKAPGYRLSPDHFQTVKRMLAPDWPQKMLCIIVPNRRTASPEFFLVNSYTTAIDSITACLAHTPKKCTKQ